MQDGHWRAKILSRNGIVASFLEQHCLSRAAFMTDQAISTIRDAQSHDPVGATDRKRELPALLKLAAPLAAANLLQMGVHAVDVIFVARLGPIPLAAASLSVAIVGLLIWSLTGLVSASAPLIAAALGRKRHAVRDIRRTMRMGIWMAVIAGVAGFALSWVAPQLMRVTGQPTEVVALAEGFVHILMWSLIPAQIAALLRVFVSALGRATIATAITACAVGLSALLNWLFVFGHAGFPAMGLYGSALASTLTTFLMMCAYIVVVLTSRRFRRYYLFGRLWRFDGQRFRELLMIGAPIGLTILAEAGLFSGAAFLMGRIGEIQLAAHTVALQIGALAFQIPFGIAQAATIRVGMAYGAGDREWIARAGWTAMGVCMASMVVTASIILFFPKLLLSIYIDVDDPANAMMVGFALQYLLVCAAFQLFDGVQAAGQGVLRGLQDTRIPMIIAISGYWIVGYGCAWWFGFHTPMAGQGVWIGLMAGLVVVSILLVARWLMRDRLGLVPQN